MLRRTFLKLLAAIPFLDFRTPPPVVHYLSPDEVCQVHEAFFRVEFGETPDEIGPTTGALLVHPRQYAELERMGADMDGFVKTERL